MANKQTSSAAGNVPAVVERLVRPVVEQMGLRLWDVRFEKEGSDWFLRVFVDRDAPMDTDTCEAVSRAIDPLLDEADPISQSYYLEVGSPGLGRRLLKPAHFQAVIGQKVAARLYKPDASGRKELVGILRSFEDDTALLDTPDGEVSIRFKEAGSFKLCDDEDLF